MCDNPQLDQTITYVSSRDYRFHFCTHLSESNKVVLFCFPKTQNQFHLLLALRHFLNTSATTISHQIEFTETQKKGLKKKSTFSGTYIICCDNTSRITSYQFQLHTKPTKSISLFCLKSTPC